MTGRIITFRNNNSLDKLLKQINIYDINAEKIVYAENLEDLQAGIDNFRLENEDVLFVRYARKDMSLVLSVIAGFFKKTGFSVKKPDCLIIHEKKIIIAFADELPLDFKIKVFNLRSKKNSLEKTLVDILKEKQLKISFGESCTGGLLAFKIIAIPGASDVIDESHVTYSNAAKIKYFDVNKQTIEKYGVVSREVVLEMVEGLSLLSGSDISISVSGIAGPDGGSVEKPVGLVYYAIKIKQQVIAEYNIFHGGRNKIQEQAAMWIFFRLWELLKS